MQTLNTRILQLLPVAQRESMRVCDIGGGDGDRVIRILTFLHGKCGTRFKLDFIEQSAFYLRDFMKRPPLGFCKTQVFDGLFENISLPQHHYDLVLLIHSIFAFENGEAIDKVLSLRSPEGKIVVISNDSNSFLCGLKRLVDEGFEGKRYEIDDLQRSLDKRGIRFSVLPFETTWAIERGQWERDTAVILNWISLGRFRSFSTERKRIVFRYIADRTKEEKDCVLFNEKESVLVIPDVSNTRGQMTTDQPAPI